MSLTKIAAQMSAMFEEREINDALNYVSSFAKEDQVKIAQFYEWLKEAEAVTKTAAAEGKKVDVVGPFTNSQRLKVAVELAHLDELTNNTELMGKAAEAAAAGALMSQVFNEYLENAEKTASEKKNPEPEKVAAGIARSEKTLRKKERKAQKEEEFKSKAWDAKFQENEKKRAEKKEQAKNRLQLKKDSPKTIRGNIKNVGNWMKNNKGKTLAVGGAAALTAGNAAAKGIGAGFGLKKLFGKKEEEKSE